MSLQNQKHKRIYLPRKLDALAYLQKKGEIMTKQMKLRGKILYADCKFMGVYLQDSLETSDPNLAEIKLVDLKTLVRKGEYKAWKETFEESTDVWLATRNMEKPHHVNQEIWVRNHLTPYFGKTKVRDIIEVDEKTGKSVVNDFLDKIDHMPKESVLKIRYCLQSILKRGNQDYKLPPSEFSNQGFYQDRFLTQEELHEILALLQDQYREVATFMAYTGLDISDVLKIEWSSVDMKTKMIRTERRKMKHNAKTIKLKIPMNQMVEAVLKNRSRVRNLHDKRIFQVCGDTHFRRRRNLQQNWRRASLDMLLKRYGHFTDETRREAILKFDQRTFSVQ